MMKTRLPLLAIMLMPFSLQALAKERQLGTMQEVVLAAEENREPAYIKHLMELFSDKVASFAKKKGIDSWEKNLALLPAVAAVVDVMNAHARDAVMSIVDAHRVWDVAATSGFGKAGTMLYNASRDTAWLATPNARYPISSQLPDGPLGPQWNQTRAAAFREAQKARGTSNDPIEKGRIVYRVSEWIVLNFTLENAEILLNEAYIVALRDLQNCDLQKNPLTTKKQWEAFVLKHFQNAGPGAETFLTPLLQVFESLVD